MKTPLEIRRVLIVDDEPEIREILKEMLVPMNLEVETAENGLKALEWLRTKEFHLVLCDIMMPQMNGLDCVAQAQSEGIITPFVFITAFGDNQRMLQAIRLGVLDFISKPFDCDEVLEVVFRVLEVGSHRSRIRQMISAESPSLSQDISKSERMISLMRIYNNKNRS